MQRRAKILFLCQIVFKFLIVDHKRSEFKLRRHLMFNKKIMALVLGAFVGTAANAQMGYLGADIGWAKPSYTGADGRLVYGAQAGAFVWEKSLSLGAFFETGPKKKSGVKQNYMTYGLDVDYHFTDFVPGLFAGLKIGMETNKLGGTSLSALAWGLEVGYDHVIADGWSIGAETSYVFVAKKSKGTGLAKVEAKAHQTWTLLANIKYWF